MDAVSAFLTDPRYRPLLRIVKAVRNGLMYGLKIRLPHSLVMTFLFHDGSIQEKIIFIIQSALEHGKCLAIFGFIYKSLGLTLERLWGANHPLLTLVSAVAGGYFAFGTNTKITMQVNMYLLSRVTIGLSKLAVSKRLIPSPPFNVFPLFAMLMWGLALLLFEYHPETLQTSMQNSMTYLHHDSNSWHNFADLLLYNNSLLW